MLILSMISASPKNGVEIMDEIEITTQGWWRPSPGSVYPVLEQLSNEGLVRKRDDGKYELTQKGEGDLQDWPPFGPRRRSSPQSVEDMLGEISSFISYFEELQSSTDSSQNKKKLRDNSKQIRALAERMLKLA